MSGGREWLTSDSDVSRVESARFRFFSPVCFGVLGDRERFSSQECFVGLEIGDLEQAQVGRNGVSDFDLADVSDNDLRRGDRDDLAISDDVSIR